MNQNESDIWLECIAQTFVRMMKWRLSREQTSVRRRNTSFICLSVIEYKKQISWYCYRIIWLKIKHFAKSSTVWHSKKFWPTLQYLVLFTTNWEYNKMFNSFTHFVCALVIRLHSVTDYILCDQLNWLMIP